jgi:hypothetical protein
MTRIKQIGHGDSTELSSGEAIDSAREGSCAATANLPFHDAHGIALGEQVRIAPTDYGIDPVQGELVICAANELAVRRTDSRAGEVIVHFPRLGFQLSRTA